VSKEEGAPNEGERSVVKMGRNIGKLPDTTKDSDEGKEYREALSEGGKGRPSRIGSRKRKAERFEVIVQGVGSFRSMDIQLNGKVGNQGRGCPKEKSPSSEKEGDFETAPFPGSKSLRRGRVLLPFREPKAKNVT